MKFTGKTKEELIEALNTLQQEHDDLRALYKHDISTLRNTEEKLKFSEEKYRMLLDGSSYGILVIDVETQRFLFSNPAICTLFGYTDEELQMLSIEDLVPKESLNLVMSEFASQMRGEKPISLALPCQKKDGTIFFADISGTPIVLNGKNCSVGFFNDVSDRKQAQESLKESESNLKQAQEIARMGHWEFDLTTQQIKLSENGFIIYGLKPFEIEPTFEYFKSRVYPEDVDLIDESIEKIVRIKAPVNFEMRVVFPDGAIKWFFTNIFPVFQNDNLLAIKGINLDITERKQFELELIKAKEKAEESDRLKSAFLANMSHEIRTPMNGILGFAELLKEPQLTGEEQQEYISIIGKSGKRMLNIINDIVSISKIESGQMEVSVSETNINEQIEYIYHVFKPEVERKGLHLIICSLLPSKEAFIKSDREKLFAILTNLVNNSIKYTLAGSIQFGVERKCDFLEFFVKDTGKGVPENQQKIIFERFRQSNDLITQPYEGAGLGLSISKAYVEMLGGKIWLESELGKGSTFYFTIPMNVDVELKPSIINISSNLEADHKGKDLKILITEDDEDSVFFLSNALKTYGKEILIVGTGFEAVEACRNNPDIDLVMMDIRMPELDGYTATRQIRKFNNDVIIIAQTAFAMTGDRQKAIAAGCNDYISKPIDRKILMGLIRKHLKV